MTPEIQEQILRACARFIRRQNLILSERLQVLESREAPSFQPGPPGATGERGPVGPQGEPGATGERGLDGSSVSLLEVLPTLQDALENQFQKYLLGLPPPKAGRDGVSPSAESVAKCLEGEFAKWALSFERQAQLILQQAISTLPKPKDGEDGKDGRDGVGVDGMTTERDGFGRVFHRWVHQGSVVKEFESREFVDRGVWRTDTEYLNCNGVTYGGSFWLCQKDSPKDKPGLSGDWRLAVKKGRDGKRIDP